VNQQRTVRPRLVQPELVERLEVLTKLLDVEPEARLLQDRQDILRALAEVHHVVRPLLADALPDRLALSLVLSYQQTLRNWPLILSIAQDREPDVVEKVALLELDLAARAVAAPARTPEHIELRQAGMRR